MQGSCIPEVQLRLRGWWGATWLAHSITQIPFQAPKGQLLVTSGHAALLPTLYYCRVCNCNFDCVSRASTAAPLPHTEPNQLRSATITTASCIGLQTTQPLASRLVGQMVLWICVLGACYQAFNTSAHNYCGNFSRKSFYRGRGPYRIIFHWWSSLVPAGSVNNSKVLYIICIDY